jgi:formylglycine-generating enzyme required for sulfatase activity
MRWIKPGEFLMGSPESEEGRSSDETQHSVRFTQGYWIADTQVSQEIWISISWNKNPCRFKDEKKPVESVTWKACEEWLRKLNQFHDSLMATLPTEAQWEYACRAGTLTAYYFGDDPEELTAYGWFFENSKRRPKPVKQLQPNGWGLYDMQGNVWEWCSDWYGDYQELTQTDPTGPADGSLRVFRGGSWKSPAHCLRSACRLWGGPGLKDDYLGFRIASYALGAEPSERAMLPVAEQGTERARIGSAEPAY